MSPRELFVEKESILIPNCKICPDDQFVDEKTEFKKKIDGLIINHFLQKEDQKYLFLKLISDEFDYVLTKYNDTNGLRGDMAIFLAYKGGNLMRIIERKYLANPVLQELSKINTDFIDAFTKSDDDFTIKINPAVPNFDKVHSDMQYLAYKTLNVIRSKLTENYFDFYNIDEGSRRQILSDTLESMKDVGVLSKAGSAFDKFVPVGLLVDGYYAGSKTLDDVSNYESMKNNNQRPAAFNADTQSYERYGSKRKDFGIMSFMDGFNALFMASDQTYYESNRSMSVYLTHNDTLTFPKPGGRVSSFTLARAKLNARVFFVDTINNKGVYADVGGELIDVSIAKKNDDELNHFYHDPVQMKTYIRNYTFEDGTGSNKFQMYGYSLDYIIDDLIRVLFADTNDRPWRDAKYARRFSRTFILYLIKIVYGGSFRVNPVTKIVVFVPTYNYADVVKSINRYAEIVSKIIQTDPLIETNRPLLKQLTSELIKISNTQIPELNIISDYIQELYVSYIFDYRRQFIDDGASISNCIQTIRNLLTMIELFLNGLVNQKINNVNQLLDIGKFDEGILSEKFLGGFI